MGKLSRMQSSGLLLLSIIGLCSAAPYSKYGRTCKDIGCLPREVCVMSYESCSFGQRENESCGRYPTCKKNTDQAAAQPAGVLNPAPDNTRTPSKNTDYQPPRESIDPNMVFGAPSNGGMYQHPAPYPNPNGEFPRYPSNNGQANYPPNPNSHQTLNYPQYPFYHDNLTPPPNVFGPFRNNYVTTTKEPSLLDQFLYNKSPKKNSSSALLPSLLLSISSLTFLLIYQFKRISC